MPKMNENTAHISLYVQPEVKDFLQRLADDEQRDLSFIVRRILTNVKIHAEQSMSVKPIIDTNNL